MFVKNKNARKILIILITCLALTTLYFLNGFFFPSRQQIAKSSVGLWLFELGIDEGLFEGPILVEENEKYSKFQCISKVPKYGDTVIEFLVTEGSRRVKGYNFSGKRESILYLAGTRRFPFTQSILNLLFGFPYSLDGLSERQKDIINVPLTQTQIEAVADFIEINRQLREYYFKYNIGYPDSLAELGVFTHFFDDKYTKDEYGNIYVYENMGDYVILGALGGDGQWDFDSLLMDSVYIHDQDCILTDEEDILVKFMPISH